MALQRPEAPPFVREMLSADPKHLKAFVGAFWPHLVGVDVASRTRVLSAERSGTLVIEVPDAAWRRELHRLQVSLLIRLREVLGSAAPRRLGFMEARNRRPRPKDPIDLAAVRSQVPAPTPLILQAAGAIPSTELRAAFIKTAATYLSTFSAGGRPPASGENK